jgi:uncharacterized radical SAM protein YgiQ
MATEIFGSTIPPVPLTTAEMDHVYDLPFARAPHPQYGDQKIPAWEMIRHSVTIMRGCFGGCSFCSITEHEGRIIQSRSEGSILKRSKRSAIKQKASQELFLILADRQPICIVCAAWMKRLKHYAAGHPAFIQTFAKIWTQATIHSFSSTAKRGRLKAVKKVMVASGVRYDLAVKSPTYIRELVEHHVGGYLKVAPEHTETGPLSKMMKPGIGSYRSL